MTNEYNPTRKEILREVVSGVSLNLREVVNRVSLKNNESKLKQAGGEFITMTGTLSLGPYVFPTTVRMIESLNEEVKLDITDKIGLGAGLLAGVFSAYAQASAYLYAINHDHPEALWFPVATNVASGAYEIGRKVYNNTKQKLISQHNKNLESTLETTEPTLK